MGICHIVNNIADGTALSPTLADMQRMMRVVAIRETSLSKKETACMVQTAFVKGSPAVEVHHLAVEVGAADGVRVALFDQIVLLADEAGDQRAPLGRGVVRGSSSQKGRSPWPRKPMFQTTRIPFCASMPLLPQRPERSGYSLYRASSSG